VEEEERGKDMVLDANSLSFISVTFADSLEGLIPILVILWNDSLQDFLRQVKRLCRFDDTIYYVFLIFILILLNIIYENSASFLK